MYDRERDLFPIVKFFDNVSDFSCRLCGKNAISGVFVYVLPLRHTICLTNKGKSSGRIELALSSDIRFRAKGYSDADYCPMSKMR